ncbi:MAG: DUF5695 domain-containing protein, partial [Gemmatimonadota bacterium]
MIRCRARAVAALVPSALLTAVLVPAALVLSTAVPAAVMPVAVVLATVTPSPSLAQEAPGRRARSPADTIPTLGLEAGISTYETPAFALSLVNASQTVAGLEPKGEDGFDFTPSDWLERRNRNRYFHLGDLTLQLRTGDSMEWTPYSTATDRSPVEVLAATEATPAVPGSTSAVTGLTPGVPGSTPAAPATLAAADLAPTLPPDIPLQVLRYWEIRDGHLTLRFELKNRTDEPVEIGALGIPMIFNNILQGRSLEEAHAVSSFHDPYIGQDAGYLQVARLTGTGSTLVVVPLEGTALEAYNPLLSDPTRRGITFEGFFEWVAHSKALAETEWAEAEPWNRPTSSILDPGESRSYGVAFLVASGVRNIEETLLANGRPVSVGVPGYVLPMDLDGRLFLKSASPIRNLEVEPADALTLSPAEDTEGGWRAFRISGNRWGRARLTVSYADGTDQTIHYKVIKPQAQVVADMGRFLTTEAWFEDPDDPFGRSPSVITYDYEEKRQVTEDNRAWVAGLGDEGGGGAWLAAIMKQLVQPNPKELEKLQRFVDEVVWDGLQYADGERQYGVRKSMFYYEPEEMPEGTYSDDVRYGGWSSWDREEAMSVGRSYD